MVGEKPEKIAESKEEKLLQVLFIQEHTYYMSSSHLNSSTLCNETLEKSLKWLMYECVCVRVHVYGCMCVCNCMSTTSSTITKYE